MKLQFEFQLLKSVRTVRTSSIVRNVSSNEMCWMLPVHQHTIYRKHSSENGLNSIANWHRN